MPSASPTKPAAAAFCSSDDENDRQVQAINTKSSSLAPPQSPPKRSHSAASASALTQRLHASSPFPLSSTLPLPPPPPPSDSAAAFDPDERFLLIHKLDRRALLLLSSAPPSSPSPPPSSDTATAVSSSSPPAGFAQLSLCLEVLYHSLSCKCELYGIDSLPVLSHAEFIVLLLTRTALSCTRDLQRQHLEAAAAASSRAANREFRRRARGLRLLLRDGPLSWLKEAERVCLQHPQLSAAYVETLQSLAFCYRLLHKPRTAIRLLRQAMRVVEEDEKADSDAAAAQPASALSASRQRARAQLCLNLSSLFALRQCWEEAALHARGAVHHCQHCVLSITAAIPLSSTEPPPSSLPLCLHLLCLAHSALASALLRLHSPSCLRWLERGREVAQSLGQDGPAWQQRLRAEEESGRRRLQEEEKEMLEREAESAKAGVRNGWRLVKPGQTERAARRQQRAARSLPVQPPARPSSSQGLLS